MPRKLLSILTPNFLHFRELNVFAQVIIVMSVKLALVETEFIIKLIMTFFQIINVVPLSTIFKKQDEVHSNYSFHFPST